MKLNQHKPTEMKTFINKKTKITIEKKEAGYANLAIMGLNTAPQGGWTTDEMRKRIKVTDKLDGLKVTAKVKLEDAEFDTLFNCVQNLKWQFIHPDIVKFDDYLVELKKD